MKKMSSRNYMLKKLYELAERKNLESVIKNILHQSGFERIRSAFYIRGERLLRLLGQV